MYKSKKSHIKGNNGITLIALVITIIVLIILASISINLILGQNGIIKRAQEATKKHNEAEIKESVEMMLSNYEISRNTTNELLEDYLSAQQQEGKIDEVINNGDGTYTIIFNGYMIKIKDDDLSILETAEETEFRKLTRGKAKFIYDQSGYVGIANITIEIDNDVSEYTVQYKDETQEEADWIDYTNGETIQVLDNGIIYGRFINKETNETGYSFILKISNIEKILPSKAIIEFDKTKVDINETIKATVIQEDAESGIDFTKSKYIVNNSENEIGIDSSLWDSATSFTANQQIIDITKSSGGTYYLHVLSTDLAENKIETVSDGIIFKATVEYMNAPYWRASDMPNWTIVGSENTTQLRVSARNSAYVITKSKVNVDILDTIEFNCNASTSSVAYSAELYFGLVETSSSSTYLKEVHNSFSRLGSSTPYKLTLDVSNLKGDYYIKILLKGTSDGGYKYLLNSATVIGK